MTKSELEKELEDLKMKFMISVNYEDICTRCKYDTKKSRSTVCEKCDDYYNEFKEKASFD